MQIELITKKLVYISSYLNVIILSVKKRDKTELKAWKYIFKI